MMATFMHQHKNRSKRRRLKDYSLPPIAPDTGLRLEWNDFFLLKETSLFLDMEGLGNAMLTCRAWRQCIVSTEKLWTSMCERRYPNILVLHPSARPRGRDQFLRRLQLDRDEHVSVRSRAWPDALRTPTTVLMNRWMPQSIVFLIDLWRNGSRIFSVAKRFKLDPEGKLLDDSSGPVDGTSPPSSKPLNVFEMEMQVDGEELIAAEALAEQFSANSSADPALRLSLAYQLEGDRVPEHLPIVLLSEHESFFTEDNHVTFHTDVDERWIPSPSYLLKADHYTERNKVRMAETWNAHAFRYGCSSLPFDPSVRVTVSPLTECLRVSPEDWDEAKFISNDGRMKYDEEGVCSVHIETTFQLGEEYEIDFSTRVFPSLLSLCEDATR